MACKGTRKTAPHPQCPISGVDHAPPQADQKAGVHVGGPGKKQEDSFLYLCAQPLLLPKLQRERWEVWLSVASWLDTVSQGRG